MATKSPSELGSGASKEAKIDIKTKTGTTADRVSSDMGYKLPTSLEGVSPLTSLFFPKDLGKYYMSFEISKYKRREEKTNLSWVVERLPGGEKLKEQTFTNFMKFDVQSEGVICLPIPFQMTDSLETDYAQENLGELVPFLAGGRPSSVNGQNMDQQGYAETVLNVLNKVYGRGLTAEMLAAKLAQTGTAINKYTTILPKGPVYKKHNFSWRLSPRNPEESVTLQKIIKTFSREMSMQVSEERLIFKAPKIFQMKFCPEDRYLYSFKPAVLQRIQANYAGNQGNVPAFFRNTGAPVTVELEMSFLELEFWQPEDYNVEQINALGAFDIFR